MGFGDEPHLLDAGPLTGQDDAADRFETHILVAANVTISHFDLLHAKLNSFGREDSSRARVYALTYPVSKLFAPKNGIGGVWSASDFELSAPAATYRAAIAKAHGAGDRIAGAANN